jgi:large subunit ribosomal protein L13
VDSLSYKTVSIPKESVEKDWLIIDADQAILGRLASKVASIAKGKHKPSFTPNVDCGDKIIVINAEKVALTGKKWDFKEYVSHSGYPGGQKRVTPREQLAKDPTKIIERAVKGMLPKNKLGSALFRNLKVYVGAEHNQEAQKPKTINLNDYL